MNQQVTVFGANGKVGSLVVKELLLRNYSVVAFVHHAHNFSAHEHLRIVQGDIYNANDVDAAVAGSAIVISTLGSWGTPKKDILTVGMGHIVASMSRHGSARLISLTGAEARAAGDSLSIIHRLMHAGLSVAAGKVLADGEKHIAILEKSGLDWTVVRSPIMTSKQPRGDRYTLSSNRPLPWRFIARRLVVLSMVDLITDTHWQQKAPYIS